ncbi:c-type cytochrome biogenesis protein CcmI [Acidocella sp.]|jgi:cytochrome c-type biogenesis protein CcmH|uniref:c-type cytochrome biogenesis protein CcmI n=1 Tax=Acidocella sp. TaxID=50710 RepID=UPI002F3FD9B2
MIFLYMLGLSLVLMTPLAFAYRGGRTRDRRGAALALHRAQLDELTRDLADQRIAAPEYAAARLEVERRLLTADSLKERALDGNARFLLIVTIIAIPLAAFALYLPGSTPDVPSEPHAQWLAQQQAANAQLDRLIALLRGRLAGEPTNTVDASQGEAYLAEALAERAGTITPEALALFKQSIANAPANASWRSLDAQRIAQAQP